MKTFRITLGARCYDTYDVKAKTPAEALNKIRNSGPCDCDVVEHELGELAGHQEYKDEDLVSVRDLGTNTDITEDVQEALGRKSSRIRVLIEAYGYNEEASLDPQAAEIVLTEDFLRRVERVAKGLEAIEVFSATLLPGATSVRSPTWYKYQGDYLADEGLSKYEQEHHLLAGIPEEYLEEARAEGHSLVVEHNGEFRWEAQGFGTTHDWCTRPLRLEDAWAILKKEMQR